MCFGLAMLDRIFFSPRSTGRVSYIEENSNRPAYMRGSTKIDQQQTTKWTDVAAAGASF
jgi:hypothetical protein